MAPSGGRFLVQTFRFIASDDTVSTRGFADTTPRRRHQLAEAWAEEHGLQLLTTRPPAALRDGPWESRDDRADRLGDDEDDDSAGRET